MTYSADLAEIRFGCGLSPEADPPGSVAAMLDGLTAPDRMAARYPIPPFDTYRAQIIAFRDLRRRMNKATDAEEQAALRQQVADTLRAGRREMARWFGLTVLRRMRSTTGFRERLHSFWADHFTVMGRSQLFRAAGSPFAEEAIRPHLTGRFADMLIAVTRHPMMLQYLDQQLSFGPSSPRAQNMTRKVGLNENLAREVLELHTLGVGGPYGQTDVRELAKLFTGMTLGRDFTFTYAHRLAEPGAETVLGRRYGGDTARFDDIAAALTDLALHPATARHLAWKLAVHFLSDTPDAALVDHVAAAYLATDGALLPTYAALLEHPAAWQPELRNVKQPLDFVASTCRALAIPAAAEPGFLDKARQRLIAPMAVMGHRWQMPSGPDGLPEADASWITPQGYAARIRWAMTMPGQLRRGLPDPRAFVDQALGAYATGPVRFAAGAAETRAEAIGLVLTSPAFQRQ